MPAQLVVDVFASKQGGATQAYPVSGGGYVLAVVDEVIPAGSPDDDDKLKTALAGIKKNIASNTENELLDEYTRYLAKKYSVSVDEAVLQSVAP